MGTQESQISKNWTLHYFLKLQTHLLFRYRVFSSKTEHLTPRPNLCTFQALFRHFWAPLRTPSVIKKNQKLIFTSILSHTSPILPKKTKNKPILNYVTLPLITLTTVQCKYNLEHSYLISKEVNSSFES